MDHRKPSLQAIRTDANSPAGRTGGLVVLAGIAAVLAILVGDGDGALAGGVPCWFHWLTGLHCPGCGATRSVRSLVAGDVSQALAYNGLVMVLAPLGLYWLVVRIADTLRGRRSARLHLPDWLGWAIIVAVLIFGALRNIPAFPFTLLAPHEL